MTAERRDPPRPIPHAESAARPMAPSDLARGYADLAFKMHQERQELLLSQEKIGLDLIQLFGICKGIDGRIDALDGKVSFLLEAMGKAALSRRHSPPNGMSVPPQPIEVELPTQRLKAIGQDPTALRAAINEAATKELALRLDAAVAEALVQQKTEDEAAKYRETQDEAKKLRRDVKKTIAVTLVAGALAVIGSALGFSQCKHAEGAELRQNVLTEDAGR
jgi:hypothetical protein